MYNAILGRPVLFDFELATIIRYLCMKFLTEGGVATMKGTQNESRVVYLATIAKGEERDKIHSEVMEVKDEEKEQRTEPVGELKHFILSDEHPD